MERFRHTLTAEEIKGMVGTAPLMLEIGCHEGSDTVKFLEAMPGVKLTCFDCEKRALSRFKDTIDQYEVAHSVKYKRTMVQLVEKAVADVDGQLDFYASTGKAGSRDDWDFSGSLCEPTGHLTRSPQIKFKEPEGVPCCRLDTWWRSMGTPDVIDFIWADVQGSQRMVIRGGREVLSRTRYLYIEAHNPIAYAGEPTQNELIKLLAEWFTPMAMYARENILFKRKAA